MSRPDDYEVHAIGYATLERKAGGNFIGRLQHVEARPTLADAPRPQGVASVPGRPAALHRSGA